MLMLVTPTGVNVVKCSWLLMLMLMTSTWCCVVELVSMLLIVDVDVGVNVGDTNWCQCCWTFMREGVKWPMAFSGVGCHDKEAVDQC